MNAPRDIPATLLDSAAVLDQVTRQWDGDIVRQLTDYIAIPAKSPNFDPDWAAHGYIETVLRNAAFGLDWEWVRDACREVYGERERRNSLKQGTNIFRVLVKTLIGIDYEISVMAVGVLKVAQGPMSQFINVTLGMPVVSPGLIFVSVLLGVGVTVLAGLLPAWNASHITPLETTDPPEPGGDGQLVSSSDSTAATARQSASVP